MEVVLNGIRVNYIVAGSGHPVVLLHGWGGSISSFAAVHKHLQMNFMTYSIDLPGFGGSDLPEFPWGTEDYAHFLVELFSALGIRNPIIFGHSFGGRLGIRLAASVPVQKLILIDSAGIKPTRPLKYYVKLYAFKSASRVLRLPLISLFTSGLLDVMRNRLGSKDYKNACPMLRAILVKAVNEDLRDLLPKISAPTLLVWGDKDTATPIADALLMEKLIPDSGLVTFPGAGHFSYLERLDQFLVVIDNFLKNEASAQNA